LEETGKRPKKTGEGRGKRTETDGPTEKKPILGAPPKEALFVLGAGKKKNE